MREHASLRLGPLRGTTPELLASPWYGAWGFCVVWEAGLPHKTSSPPTQRRNGRACSSLTARGGGLPVGVMDNSSIHRSEEFEDYIAQWKKKGLRIKYLIPYAQELNLIEILWRHIKYLWFPFSAYQCMEALREALEHILKDFGSKYQITFA